MMKKTLVSYKTLKNRSLIILAIGQDTGDRKCITRLSLLISKDGFAQLEN